MNPPTLQALALIAVSLAAGFAPQQPEAPAAPVPEATAGHVTSKDGTRIGYGRSGTGPVLVLCSGALSERTDLAPLATLLSAHFTVLNHDRRGRGESGDTPPYAVEREVEDIAALLDAAVPAGGKAFVFGHSSGAVLALEAASRLPDRIARAVLFEPPFVVDESRPPVPADFVAHVTELVAAGRRSDAVAYFMSDAVGIPAEFVERMRQMPMWPGLESRAHTLAYDGTLMGATQAGKPLPPTRWAGAVMPALVLSGGASDPWLHAAAEALAELVPGAEHRVLEGLDHSAAVMAPGVLAPVLVEFFGD